MTLNYKIYDIDPSTKPRMTQRDKWKQRPCVMKYNTFKDMLRLLGVTVPDSGYHVLFVMPMPPSWKDKEKDKMRFTGFQNTPDKDNLEKALLDSLFKNDAHIWDGRASKVWGDSGKIIIIIGIDTSWIKTFLEEVL